MTTSHRRLPIVDRIGFSDLAAVSGEWDRLLASSTNPTPFLASPWLRAWVDTVGSTCEPRIVTARDPGDGSLVGAAPFVVAPVRRNGYAYRALRFLGAGPIGASRLDLIVRPDDANTVAGALWDLVCRDRTWDLIDLAGVVAGGPLAAALHRRRGDEDRARTVPATLSVETHRAPEGVGVPGRFRLVTSHGEVVSTMQRMSRMVDVGADHGRLRAPVGHPSVAGFHREAMRRLLDAGRLRLWTLDMDGDTLGAFYALRFGEAIAGYAVTVAEGMASREAVVQRLVAGAAAAADGEGADRLLLPQGVESSVAASSLTALHVMRPVGAWGRLLWTGLRTRTALHRARDAVRHRASHV